MRLVITSLAFLALFFTGCQTASKFTAPDPSWSTRVGQLKYTNGTRVLVGDVVVRTHGADFQLDFQKAGGVSLMNIRQNATMSSASGILARRAWQGRTDKTPEALRAWLHLPAALEVDRDPDVPWEYGTVTMSGGQLKDLSARYRLTDENFDFHFTR